jgi:hypothetical protein
MHVYIYVYVERRDTLGGATYKNERNAVCTVYALSASKCPHLIWGGMMTCCRDEVEASGILQDGHIAN